jgi:hypothetical protein
MQRISHTLVTFAIAPSIAKNISIAMYDLTQVLRRFVVIRAENALAEKNIW